MSIKLVTWISTYIIIILCELGDKTQLAVLLMTSKNPGRRWTIFLASALALSCCVLVEVTVGLKLAQYLGPHIINRLAGVIFLVMGLYGMVRYFHDKTVARTDINKAEIESLNEL